LGSYLGVRRGCGPEGNSCSCRDLACAKSSTRWPRRARVYHLGMAESFAPEVAAFVLAGGKSTRMGRDKAFVEFEGRTLLARALDVTRSVTPDVRIVGAAEKFSEKFSGKFAAFAPVVEDVFRDCGPLGGIHAALQASSVELNLVLAVDTPFVPPSFLQFLIRRAQSVSNAAATVPRVAGRWEPLCAVYRRPFGEAAESALRAARYKIDPLFAMVVTTAVEQEELEAAGFSPEIFRNLNTEKDLKSAQEKAAS